MSARHDPAPHGSRSDDGGSRTDDGGILHQALTGIGWVTLVSLLLLGAGGLIALVISLGY